jgi:hypothetical protein
MSWCAVSVIVAAIATLCGVACGTEPEDGSGSAGSTTQPGTIRTTMYFLTDGGAAPIGVRRAIHARSPHAREALETLLAGPTSEEAESGISTAIPEGTQVLAMTYRHHGADETVNLSGLPREGADPVQQHRIITQIARTLIGVSGIERVWFLDHGQPWGLTLRNGRIDNGPFDYGRLVGWDIGRGCPRTEAVTCDRFVALP